MIITPIRRQPPARVFANLISLLILVAGIISSSAPLILGADETQGENYAVGVTSRAFEDAERTNWPRTGPRPIRVTLWYPCASGQVQEMVNDSGKQVPATPDGKISETLAKYPLIMISHGSGGNASGMLWLGYYLAQHGYIAAALDHNGNAEEELHMGQLTPTDFFGWERARDVSVALTRLLADPTFSEKIDGARIGAAGFSLGATTVLWTAGARLNLDTLRAKSPPPPPVMAASIERLVQFSKEDVGGRESAARANLSYRDSRIRAVFSLAPPMGAGFPDEGLKEIAVPVSIVVGDADLIAPASTNARHFADNIPSARYIVLPGERGHYLRPIPPEQRHVELTEVAEFALHFFEENNIR